MNTHSGLFHRRESRSRRGAILIGVVIFSAIVAIITVGLIGLGIHQRNQAARLDLYNAELTAAESVLESMVSQVYFLGLNRPPQVVQSATGLNTFVENELLAPSVPGFDVAAAVQTLVEDDVREIDEDLAEQIGGDVAGWIGYKIRLSSYRILAGARAESDEIQGSKRYARPGVYISRVVSFYQVPLLNYAIFYENVMELDAGARIDVKGKVHTNRDWYLTTSSSAYYHDQCTVAGRFYGGIYNPLDGYRRSSSSFGRGWSGSNSIFITDDTTHSPGATLPDSKFQQLLRSISQIPINNGFLASVNYNNKPLDPTAWTPYPDWVDMANRIFRGNLKDAALGAKAVKLKGLNETASPHLLIEAPNLLTDTSDMIESKLAYQAAVIIETGTSWPGNPNDFVAYRLIPDSTSPTGFTQSDSFALTYRLSTDAPTATPRKFLSTVSIYNGREEKMVDLVDIDMGKFADYLKSSSTSAQTGLSKFSLDNPRAGVDDGMIYIKTRQPSGRQGAVRISNAKDLRPVLQNSGMDISNGLSIITESPFYTKGHINDPGIDEGILPLLLAGDSMNVLSSVFNDADYATVPKDSKGVPILDGPCKTAANTTTNAVFLTGNVPTKANQYGGGGENFYRYLEAWSGKTHKYKGSMLNLFESRIALGCWDKDTGTSTKSGYYSPPTRNWTWDASFASGRTPPGMPRSFDASTSNWRTISMEEFVDLGGVDLSFPPSS